LLSNRNTDTDMSIASRERSLITPVCLSSSRYACTVADPCRELISASDRADISARSFAYIGADRGRYHHVAKT